MAKSLGCRSFSEYTSNENQRKREINAAAKGFFEYVKKMSEFNRIHVRLTDDAVEFKSANRVQIPRRFSFELTNSKHVFEFNFFC